MGCVAGAVGCVVQTAADLAADLTRKVPTKIDIGPVYTHDPRQRAKYAKGERGSRHCTNTRLVQQVCLVQHLKCCGLQHSWPKWPSKCLCCVSAC
jgi:hypothetical protein